uniref:hypothetical protein n=1 Tax=Aliarcobacter sp. TaxID=2321116 RepID=UPI0040470ACC
MENTNTVSIPLVDVLSELLEKRVVMSGDDYVIFDTLEKISNEVVSEGLLLKEQKERILNVPMQITARQARLALLQIGKLADVAAAISNLNSPIKEQVEIEWEYATDIYRNHNFIEVLGSSLGLDANALDDLFIIGKEY